jgi:Initiator Replication protein
MFVAHLTIDQKPTATDFAKARELIEIRGTGELSLQDRRVINILYQNAGTRLCDDVEHVISIATLRGEGEIGGGGHKGSERVKDSILRLMKTVVQVPTVGKNGRPATRRVQVLSDTTTSDDEDDPTGQVVYSFSPGMRAIIKDSTLWGRVRTAVVFAFTSKYSLALYELITARINLKHIWQEEIRVEDLRALLGVPDGKLERIPNLLQKVIRPAEAEVGGIAEFGVKIEPLRKGGPKRGLVTGFRMSWWRKSEDELRQAYKELEQSKVGRIARLTGKTEQVRAAGGIPGISDDVAKELADLRTAADTEVAAKLEGMRAKTRAADTAEVKPPPLPASV